MRGLVLDQSALTVFNLNTSSAENLNHYRSVRSSSSSGIDLEEPAEYVSVCVWSHSMSGRLLWGDSLLQVTDWVSC